MDGLEMVKIVSKVPINGLQNTSDPKKGRYWKKSDWKEITDAYTIAIYNIYLMNK